MSDELFAPLDTLLARVERHGDGSHERLKRNRHRLARIASSSDSKVIDELVRDNWPLVLKTAKHYLNRWNHDLPLEDLVSAGLEGLLTAIDRFDIDRQWTLSTYALHWIRQKIVREIRNTGYRIRIPVHRLEQINRLQTILSSDDYDPLMPSKRRLHLNPELRELSNPNLRIAWQAVLSNRTSINVRVNDEGDTLEQLLSAETNAFYESSGASLMPDNDLMEYDLVSRIEHALSFLKNDKQREVIRRRFGLGGQKVETLEEIGASMSVTRERIRQIEVKAIERLRQVQKIHRIFDQHADLGEDSLLVRKPV
jgi:RNA polymerase sigma factor (sigma-70 family)